MRPNELFVGLVTYPGSRFNAQSEATSQHVELLAALEGAGIPASGLVSDRNDYTPGRYPITRRLLVESAVHQAELERRWRRYLVSGGASGRAAWTDHVFSWGMAAKRVARAVGANPFRDGASMPGARALVRLINIDLSHVRLLEEGLHSGARWILVLEDDGAITDVDVAARQLGWLLTRVQEPGVELVNLSYSIPLGELGVTDLLVDEGVDVPADLGFRLLRATRPVTNTVCANLYRADLARDIVASIRSNGLLPVAPIDWRVNQSLMGMWDSGRLGDQSCVWVDPGIVVQRSMH